MCVCVCVRTCVCVCLLSVILYEENKIYFLSASLVIKLQIWNLYSEISLKAKLFEVTLYFGTLGRFCSASMWVRSSVRGRRFTIQEDTEWSHCSMSGGEAEAETFPEQETKANCPSDHWSLPSECLQSQMDATCRRCVHVCACAYAHVVTSLHPISRCQRDYSTSSHLAVSNLSKILALKRRRKKNDNCNCGKHLFKGKLLGNKNKNKWNKSNNINAKVASSHMLLLAKGLHCFHLIIWSRLECWDILIDFVFMLCLKDKSEKIYTETLDVNTEVKKAYNEVIFLKH